MNLSVAPPVISLASPSVVSDIDKACRTWGAFVLTDHGIPDQVLQSVLSTGHSFFDLPLQTKEKYNLQKFGAKWRGYMPLGGETSVRGTVTDKKEGLYLGDEHPPDHPMIGSPTFGSNVFPDDEMPEMKGIFLNYHERMRALGNQRMVLLAKALGLEADYMQDHVTEHDPVILPRMFRYPPQSRRDDKANEWGIGRHSDYGLWTMILTDAPGLEFQNPETNTWHNVPVVENAIIMNVGDVLDRLTAGRYVSAYHRARNLSTSSNRLSLPFFYDPSWTARMKQLPIADTSKYDTTARAERWSKTKITCEFDGTVEYSEFLAKKVAKVFPDLVPETFWATLHSTSAPSTRHALVVDCPDVTIVNQAMDLVIEFYKEHTEIKVSHGWEHVEKVYKHACNALLFLDKPISSTEMMEIKLAALLHDFGR